MSRSAVSIIVTNLRPKAVLLAGVIIAGIGMIGIASAASFTDLEDGAWYTPVVEGLARARIITGNEDENGRYTGTFRPLENVTLAEAIKMALRSAKWKLPTGVPSNLSAQGTWAAPYVNAAAQARISVFRSNALDVYRTATREEVTRMFADIFRVSAHGSLRQSLLNDLGTSDAAPLSRAHAAVLLTRFLALSPVAPVQPAASVAAPANPGASSSAAAQASSAPAAMPTVSATHRVTASANMRSGAGMDYRVVRVLRPGDLLSVLSVSGPWSEVMLLDGVQGFVISTSIEAVNGSVVAPYEPAPVPSQTPALAAGDAVITGAVNVRARADINSPALGSYPAGTPVTVLDDSQEIWVLIRLQNGKEGYVSRKFLKIGE
jgi:SH3-like domain-containing protein